MQTLIIILLFLYVLQGSNLDFQSFKCCHTVTVSPHQMIQQIISQQKEQEYMPLTKTGMTAIRRCTHDHDISNRIMDLY